MKRKLIALSVVVIVAAGVFAVQRYSPERQGERAFVKRGCTGCHFSGAGPTLTRVASKHDAKTLEEFIVDPPAFYRQRKMQPLNAGYMLMPKVAVTEEEARHIVAYLSELNGE